MPSHLSTDPPSSSNLPPTTHSREIFGVSSTPTKSIFVLITDVRPNDILYFRGQEDDPVISEVEHQHLAPGRALYVKFHYRPQPGSRINESLWMDTTRLLNKCWIHDLHREGDNADVPAGATYSF